MKLHCVRFKVRPSQHHPAFFDAQCGYLYLWIFADSEQDCADRGKAIVKQLPYELMAKDCGVDVDTSDADEETRLIFQSGESAAKRDGLAMRISWLSVGMDEDYFKKEF